MHFKGRSFLSFNQLSAAADRFKISLDELMSGDMNYRVHKKTTSFDKPKLVVFLGRIRYSRVMVERIERTKKHGKGKIT